MTVGKTGRKKGSGHHLHADPVFGEVLFPIGVLRANPALGFKRSTNKMTTKKIQNFESSRASAFGPQKFP